LLNKIRIKKEKFGMTLKNIASSRVKFARWLLDKLLGSFFISFLILYNSIFGFQLTQSPFQIVYFLVTFLSILAYIISIILIPVKNNKAKNHVNKI
jgi:hypothetical protein